MSNLRSFINVLWVAMSACFLMSFSSAALSLTELSHLKSFLSKQPEQNLFVDGVKVGDAIFLAGEQGRIVKSNDNGASWTQLETPTSVLLTGIDFPSTNLGWAVGHDGMILNTSDGGDSWNIQLTHEDVNQSLKRETEKEIASLKQQLATTKEIEQEELKWALEDAEFTLEDLSFGNLTPFLDIAFVDAQTGVAVGAYGLIFRTTNGGKDWYSIHKNIDNSDRFHFNAITKTKNGYLYVVGETGLVFKSKDQGEHWERLDTGFEGSLFGLQAHNQVLLAFGVEGKVIRSTDSGKSWKKISTPVTSTLLDLTFLNKNEVVAVGADGVLLHSTNTGRTFEQKTTHIDTLLTQVIPIGSQVMVASFSKPVVLNPKKPARSFKRTHQRSPLAYSGLSQGAFFKNTSVRSIVLEVKDGYEIPFKVMSIIERIQWELHNQYNISESASLVDESKYVNMQINEGNPKQYFVPRLQQMMNTTLRTASLGILSETATVINFNVGDSVSEEKFESIVESVMNKYHKHFPDYYVSTSAVDTFNILQTKKSNLLSGHILLKLSAKSGDVFSKSYLSSLDALDSEIILLKHVDRANFKALNTPNLRWKNITNEGVVGGYLLPFDQFFELESLKQKELEKINPVELEKLNQLEFDILEREILENIKQKTLENLKPKELERFKNKVLENLKYSGLLGYVVSPDLKSTYISVPIKAAYEYKYDSVLKKHVIQRRIRPQDATRKVIKDILDIKVDDSVELSVVESYSVPQRLLNYRSLKFITLD